jgi:AraC-like DNA-binding protein
MLKRVPDSHRAISELLRNGPLDLAFFQVSGADHFAPGYIHEKIVPFGIAAQATVGAYEVTCRGQTVKVSGSEAFITPASVPLRIVHHHARDGFAGQWVHFSFLLYQSIEITSLLELPLAVDARRGEAIGQLISELRGFASAGGDSLATLGRAARERELAWHLFGLLCQIARARPGALDSLETGKRLQPLLHHLNAHLEDRISVPRMAKLARMSPSRLFGYFRDRLDCTPMGYVGQLRLRKAAALLSQWSQPSVKEVAAATGFASASHLSREFKRRYGVSPRGYRDREAMQLRPHPGTQRGAQAPD